MPRSIPSFPYRQNFCSNVLQLQFADQLTGIDGGPNGAGRALDTLDRFFTGVFAVELALNMFALWFSDFWSDGWNWCA